MIDSQRLIKALRISRDEFAHLFLQAQVELPVRMNFDALVADAVGDGAFLKALAYAKNKQFYDELVNAIIEDQLVDQALIAQLMVESARNRAGMQAVTNQLRGFITPKTKAYDLLRGIKCTCKVLIDGKSSGTGTLIGPNLIITSWHVVRALFDLDLNTIDQYIAKEAVDTSLSVEFDNYEGYQNGSFSLRSSTPVRIRVHKEWLVCFRSCHEAETHESLPDVLTDLTDCWDYAVIRLARPIGYERPWSPPDPNAAVPRVGRRVIVFQHAGGESLKIDEGPIASLVPANPAVFPGMRFLYDVNTLNGSSGGPCFDQSFKLFGLHQGEWPQKNGQQKLNRGVPTAGILKHIAQTVGELPTPDPAERAIWSLGKVDNFHPVLGCDDFQTIVWKSALSATSSLLPVATGGPDEPVHRLMLLEGPPGSGKSFRINVLTTMLPAANHLFVQVDAASISKLSATELVAFIAGKVGQPVPVIRSQEEAKTTASAWLRAVVLPSVITLLHTARDNRLVWLLFTNLNRQHIDGPLATDLLSLLYEQVKTEPWLRIVLDGMRGDIPRELSEFVVKIEVGPLTRDDIATYLRRFLTRGNQLVDDLIVNVTTRRLLREYEAAWLATPDTAVASLSQAMIVQADDIMTELADLI